MTDQRAFADRIDPRLSHEPVDNADIAEPIDATHAAEPTEPMDSTEPLDAIDSTESRDHKDSKDPWWFPCPSVTRRLSSSDPRKSEPMVTMLHDP